MKIAISSTSLRRIILYFPTGLIFNDTTATIAGGMMPRTSKTEQDLSAKEVRVLFRVLRQVKIELGNIPILDVESSTGDRVTIYL